MTTTDKIHQTLRDSAGMRWLVLLLLAFAMFCSYIFMDILLSLIHISEPTRQAEISYAVFCLKKKKKTKTQHKNKQKKKIKKQTRINTRN